MITGNWANAFAESNVTGATREWLQVEGTLLYTVLFCHSCSLRYAQRASVLGILLHCIKFVHCIVHLSSLLLASPIPLTKQNNNIMTMSYFIFLVPKIDSKRMLTEGLIIQILETFKIQFRKYNPPERLLFLGLHISFPFHSSVWASHPTKCGYNLLSLPFTDNRINELTHMNYFELFWIRTT